MTPSSCLNTRDRGFQRNKGFFSLSWMYRNSKLKTRPKPSGDSQEEGHIHGADEGKAPQQSDLELQPKTFSIGLGKSLGSWKKRRQHQLLQEELREVHGQAVPWRANQTKPCSTALSHGIKRRSWSGRALPFPVLCANTIPRAELRWAELSWDAGRVEQIPSSLLQPSTGLTSNPHGQADGILKINLVFGLGRHLFKSLQSNLLVPVPLASPGSPVFSSMENTKAAALPDPYRGTKSQHLEAQEHHSLFPHPLKGLDPPSCTAVPPKPG